MADFNYLESFEFLAERFYSESGYMAPGKSVAPEMAYSQEEDDKRRELWSEFMTARNEEAWVLWHQKHGYLSDTAHRGQRDEI